MKRRSFFTFLEVMIALVLLMIAGSAVSWKMHQWIQKRRFQSDLEQLRSRFFTCHHLALTMQADWRGVLRPLKGKWRFEASCLDPSINTYLPPITLHSFTLSFKGEVQKEFAVDFFSTGTLFPQGELTFYQDVKDSEGLSQTWQLPHLFLNQEGDGKKDLGPLHPDD